MKKNTLENTILYCKETVTAKFGDLGSRPNSFFYLILAGFTVCGAVVTSLILLRNRRNNSKKDEKVKLMRAVVATSYNGMQSLKFSKEAKMPKLREPDQVLIQVKAAGVDPMDLRILQGYGKVLRRHINRFDKNESGSPPIILGRDCAGVVLEVGQQVTNIHPGDQVWAFSESWQPGLMAEYVVVKSGQVGPMPKNLNFDLAASFPYVAMVTWNALVHMADIGPHSTKRKRVLIHNGFTSYGSLAIQLVKAWGGHVTTTVPTFGLPLARLLGADDVIVYSVTCFQEELKKKEKFDVILNDIGTVLHSSCIDVCAPGGKVVSIVTTPVVSDDYGFILGTIVALLLQFKVLLSRIIGQTGSYSWENMHFTAETLSQIKDLVQAAKLTPVVEKVAPIEDAIQAFKHVEDGTAVGRTVVKIT